MCTPLLNLHADFDFSMRGLIHLRESINSFESTLSLEAVNITGIYSLQLSGASRSNVRPGFSWIRAVECVCVGEFEPWSEK